MSVKGIVAASFACILGVLAPVHVFANEVKCNNCSENAYKAVAKQQGWGTHYVYDLVKGNVRKFEVEVEPDGDGGALAFAFPRPVEQDMTTIIQELSAYYVVTAGQMTSHFELHTNGTVSGLNAYDVAGPGGPRSQLLTWISGTASASIRNALPMEGAILHNMLIQATSIFKKEMGLTTVVIVFTDGSKISLQFDSLNGVFSVVEGTAVDALGNIIITHPDQLVGLRFDYTGDTNGYHEQKMKDYLSLWGVQVTGSTKWGCTVVGSETRCYPY